MIEFADYVAAGVRLRAGRDETSWGLGDLAEAFLADVAAARDRLTEDEWAAYEKDHPTTLSDLADAWNVSRQRAGEFRNVAAFYPTDARPYKDTATWEMHNLARRNSDGSLDNALELLAQAETMHWSVRDFQRYLSGTIWEGPLWWAVLPDVLKALVPPGLRVWVSVKRYREGES